MRAVMMIRAQNLGCGQLAGLIHTQTGFVAVTIVLLISALIGFTRLSAEVGTWHALKRQNQTAADAAALSTAFEYAGNIETGVATNPSAAATSTAVSNQFDTAAPNTVLYQAVEIDTPTGGFRAQGGGQ